MTNGYTIQYQERVQIILNWLGREVLKVMQRLNDEEKENCKVKMGLFEVFCEKFMSQHSETILSSQYCKLIRKQNENAKERMGQPEPTQN